MEHYRLRKYRGPETWARVRDAYEAGESGPSCARRFDVGVSNLRKKCRAEGWSRKDQARKLDLPPMRGEADRPPAPAPPEPHAHAPEPGRSGPTRLWRAPVVGSERRETRDGRPVIVIDIESGEIATPVEGLQAFEAVEAAMVRATHLMAEGRAAEATALVKAVEAMCALTGDKPPSLAPVMVKEVGYDARTAFVRTIEFRAMTLAQAMHDAGATTARVHRLFRYHYRATHLGPETAAEDREAASAEDRAIFWDADGVLVPKTELDEPTRTAIGDLLHMTFWFGREGGLKGFWDASMEAWPESHHTAEDGTPIPL